MFSLSPKSGVVDEAAEMLTSHVLTLFILLFSPSSNSFKCQLCSKHYDGQYKYNIILAFMEFTCYAGDKTCTPAFRMKGLWDKCPDNGPDKMSRGEQIKH